jgi:actin-like ATPase involved in cell morphogenesis
MDERKDHLWKVQDGSEAAAGEDASHGMPLGVDVGTSKIVAARRRTKGTETLMQLNAFIPVPFSRFTETILGQNEIPYFRDGDELIIFGGATERFANMFNVETRRPMADGLLNPKERMGAVVLESIMKGLIPKAKTQGEVLSFSVPAASEGREAELVYHEASLRRFFETLGYRAVAINEGLAVIFSELEDQNFTGIGISCGGGMCNVALAYLSIPSLLFGISKGGDYIDHSVGAVVNEPSTRIKNIKEEKLDLTKAPVDKLEKALHIYYEDLVESLVDSIRKAVAKADKLPRAHRPLPIVIAGGTAKPKGFKELFEKSMKSKPFPVDISEVRVASDPVTATARGALIAALYEK